KPIPGAQGPLEMHLIAAGKMAEIGLLERFTDDVERDLPRLKLGDRETRAVDGDRLAKLQVIPVAGDGQPPKLRAVGCPDHARCLFNDAGEHALKSMPIGGDWTSRAPCGV